MAEMTVSAEALKALCVALGEPYETPSGHPMEPPYQMTWERALDLVRGRTAAWASFLTRIEEVDPAWLNEQRSRAGSRTSTVASATESVDTATAEAPTRTEPDRLTGATIPINPDGTTDWPRFAAELRTGPAMTTTLLHIAGPLLILTSVASAVIAHLPLPPSTRSYYKHTAWEMLAIAFIAATMAQMPHPAGVTITVTVTIYSLTRSTEHYNTWQTLRAPSNNQTNTPKN